MTIKQFIEKAIEGGWTSSYCSYTFVDNKKNYSGSNYHAILLDPKAWEAVGKIEGWDNACQDCGGINEAQCQCENRVVIDGYRTKMHRMIDALCEGKSIEDFIIKLKTK